MLIFLKLYVKNAKPLPFEEYYGKLGIKYLPELKTGEIVPTMGANFGVPDGKIRLTKLIPELNELGVELNDELHAINGVEISLNNANKELSDLMQKPIDEAYTLTVKRGDEIIKIDAKIFSKEKVKKYIFTLDNNATDKQKELRAVWMKNL